MENLDKFVDFAPLITVILMFIYQFNVLVRPEQLEKKHREIIQDVEERFVTWTVFNTVVDSLKIQMNRVDNNVEKLCELFLGGGGNKQ